MRPKLLTALTLSLAVGAGAASAFAGETRTREAAPAPDDELTLPAAEVSHTAWAWTPEIRACWLKHATRRARADGNLRVELTVAPTGLVWRHTTAYAGARSRPLDRCLDRVVAQLRFSLRRDYTPAVIPFLFRAARRPGTGPVMSCHNPRGCRRRAGR